MKAAKASMVAASVVLAGLAFDANAEVAKELDAYKGGLGKWSCDAKDVGSGKMFKASIEVSAEFEGHTYVEKYTEYKSADHPNPWSAVFIMSYDAASKRWVRNGLDNSGNFNSGSSSGWQGKTWVWDVGGANIVVEDQGSKARTFAVDVKQDGGGVKRVVEASCKRI